MGTISFLLAILQIVTTAIAAQTGSKPFDYGAAALRIVAAARALYAAETGAPMDESKIPPFEPIP